MAAVLGLFEDRRRFGSEHKYVRTSYLWYDTDVIEISVAEAAQRLGIGEQRVRSLAASGHLPARRLGHAWALDSAAVDARMKGARRGRPLSARSAWALLLLLEGRSDEIKLDRKSTRLNSSHLPTSRMPSSA